MKPLTEDAQPFRPHLSRLRWLAAAFSFCLSLATHVHAALPVPVAFVDGLPVVNVKLGAVKVDFLLDTGGQIGITVPAPLVTPATEVIFTGGVEQRGDAAGNRFEVKQLRANSVVIGGEQLGPVDGLLHFKWGLSIASMEAPSVTQKGVIGLKALDKKNVLFDLRRNRLELFERRTKAGPDVAGWTPVPFEYDRRGVVVALVVNNIPAKMALDTAATATMIKKDSILFNHSRPPCPFSRKDSDFCGMLNLKGARLADLSLLDAQAAVVKMGSVPFDGLLGIDFFLNHEIYFDFDASTLYVRPLKGTKR